MIKLDILLTLTSIIFQNNLKGSTEQQNILTTYHLKNFCKPFSVNALKIKYSQLMEMNIHVNYIHVVVSLIIYHQLSDTQVIIRSSMH